MASQSTEIYIGVATLLIGGLFVFVLFLVFTLVAQKKVVALQKKLLKAEILTIEKERERIASDLHDSLGPTMSAMVLMNKEIVVNDTYSLEIQQELNDRLIETSEQVREIARNITPKIYEDTDLRSLVGLAVRDIDLICKEKGITLNVRVNGDLILDKESNLHLFRIIQEVLNNACKHSKASIITFTAAYNQRLLILAFHDNGIGFNTHDKSDGLGLSNIHNRVALLNATYHIESGNKTGTEIVVKLACESRSIHPSS